LGPIESTPPPTPIMTQGTGTTLHSTALLISSILQVGDSLLQAAAPTPSKSATLHGKNGDSILIAACMASARLSQSTRTLETSAAPATQRRPTSPMAHGSGRYVPFISVLFHSCRYPSSPFFFTHAGGSGCCYEDKWRLWWHEGCWGWRRYGRWRCPCRHQ
jgi:hypothetical protein